MRQTLDPVSELYHFGIKNMKWGVNRYQLRDGTWTKEGLERRRDREGFGEKAITREEVINSGNPKLVNRFRSELSTQELRSALDRIDTLQRLDTVLARPRKERTAFWVNNANKLVQTFGNVTTWLASTAGKETLSWLTGQKEKELYWDNLIKGGDYDKIAKEFDRMPISYQKKALDAMKVRDAFTNKKWDKNSNNP